MPLLLFFLAVVRVFARIAFGVKGMTLITVLIVATETSHSTVVLVGHTIPCPSLPTGRRSSRRARNGLVVHTVCLGTQMIL